MMASIDEGKLESVSYDDEEEEDDDDDDLLKPVFAKKASSPLSKSSVIVTPPADTPSSSTATLESIKERARATAQCNLKYQRSDYAGLSLSDFYWEVHRSPNHQEIYYPCHITAPDQLHGYCGSRPRRGQVAIRYIGMSECLRPPNHIFAIVSRKQLVPYNESRTAAEDTSSSSSMIVTAPIPHWCPQRMEHMRELVLQNDHHDDTTIRDEILKESIYLDCVLELVMQLQDEPEDGLFVPQQVTMESEDESGSCGDEEDEGSVQQETGADDKDPSKANPVEEEKGSTECSVAALPPVSAKRQRMMIRAGDVIMYSWRTSTIKTVWGNSQLSALYLFNGAYLPRDCRIVVRRRFLRNKLQDAIGEPHVWRNLSECTLVKGEISYDPANPTGPTMQEKCAQIMEDGRREMLNWNPEDGSDDDCSDDGNDDDDDDDIATPIQSLTNTKDDVPPAAAAAAVIPTKSFATPPGTKAAKRRTASLGAKTAHKRQQERQFNQSLKPPSTTTGKRKANAISSPADESNGEPRWKQELEAQLESCAQERKKRRYDFAGVQVRERSLQMAIRVRLRKDWSDTILEQLAEEWELQHSTLKTYLNGNPRNLLFKDAVRELTDKFASYLDGLQDVQGAL